MGNAILDLAQHPLFLAVLTAWVVAQILKAIFPLLTHGTFDWHRLVEPGGMPSSHAAAVIALFIGVGIREGWTSTISILALVFALAILYEAVGVRKTLEDHAKLLEHLVQYHPPEQPGLSALRTPRGHTPAEVGVGVVIGVVVGLWWML